VLEILPLSVVKTGNKNVNGYETDAVMVIMPVVELIAVRLAVGDAVKWSGVNMGTTLSEAVMLAADNVHAVLLPAHCTMVARTSSLVNVSTECRVMK
jgi:hypothetical protein